MQSNGKGYHLGYRGSMMQSNGKGLTLVTEDP